MVLITGIPCAGKTTYSARYDNVVHFDDVIGPCKKKFASVLDLVKDDNDAVVEGVYWRAKDRRELVEASRKKNTCIWLDTPLDECVKRETRSRNRPCELVTMCAESYEQPTYAEGWDEIIINRDGIETVLERGE